MMRSRDLKSRQALRLPPSRLRGHPFRRPKKEDGQSAIGRNLKQAAGQIDPGNAFRGRTLPSCGPHGSHPVREAEVGTEESLRRLGVLTGPSRPVRD